MRIGSKKKKEKKDRRPFVFRYVGVLCMYRSMARQERGEAGAGWRGVGAEGGDKFLCRNRRMSVARIAGLSSRR